MPIYEFSCQQCTRQFELICKYSELDTVACRFCQSKDVERLVSMGSFQLKGSGWAHDAYGVDASNAPPVTKTDHERTS